MVRYPVIVRHLWKEFLSQLDNKGMNIYIYCNPLVSLYDHNSHSLTGSEARIPDM